MVRSLGGMVGAWVAGQLTDRFDPWLLMTTLLVGLSIIQALVPVFPSVAVMLTLGGATGFCIMGYATGKTSTNY